MTWRLAASSVTIGEQNDRNVVEGVLYFLANHEEATSILHRTKLQGGAYDLSTWESSTRYFRYSGRLFALDTFNEKPHARSKDNDEANSHSNWNPLYVVISCFGQEDEPSAPSLITAEISIRPGTNRSRRIPSRLRTILFPWIQRMSNNLGRPSANRRSRT